MKIVRTLMLLFSYRPVAAPLVINFEVIVNEVVLFASRISFSNQSAPVVQKVDNVIQRILSLSSGKRNGPFSS